MRHIHLAALLIVVVTLQGFDATPPAEQESIDVRKILIADWERAKAYTQEYLAAMPEDGINLKPTPEMRSFAEQMLHMAQGTIGLSANGTGRERIYPNMNFEKNDEFKKSKEALTKVVMESYDFAIAGIRGMDDTRLNEVVKRGNFDVTRVGWVMKAFEHQTHHRGQCTVYLRLKGITPPNERLF